jgi:hypothetical protein
MHVVISDDMPKENNRLRPHLRFFGSLLVQVDLASQSWATPDKDRQQAVTARFLTDCTATDAFASELELVLQGLKEAAVLCGVSD